MYTKGTSRDDYVHGENEVSEDDGKALEVHDTVGGVDWKETT